MQNEKYSGTPKDSASNSIKDQNFDYALLLT